MSIAKRISEKVNWERESMNGWYGDEHTPLRWRVESMTPMTKYLAVHLHEIETDRCVKNRFGVFCT